MNPGQSPPAISGQQQQMTGGQWDEYESTSSSAAVQVPAGSRRSPIPNSHKPMLHPDNNAPQRGRSANSNANIDSAYSGSWTMEKSVPVSRTRSRSPGGTGLSGAIPSRRQSRGAPSPEKGRRTVNGNYQQQQRAAHTNMTVATGDSDARALSPPSGRGRLMEGVGTVGSNTLHSKSSAVSDSNHSLHLADSSMQSQADPWETPNTQNPSWNVNLNTAATASNSASNNSNNNDDTDGIEFNNYNDEDAAWFVAAPRSVSAVSQSAINTNANASDWGSACGTDQGDMDHRNHRNQNGGGQVAGFGGINSNDDDDQWNNQDNWFGGSKSNDESQPLPTQQPKQQPVPVPSSTTPVQGQAPMPPFTPKLGSVERPIAIDDQGMDDALNARENDVLRLAARKSSSMNSLSQSQNNTNNNSKASLALEEIDIDSRDQDVLQTAQRKFGSRSVAESNTGSNSNVSEQPSVKSSAKPSSRSPSRASSVDTRSSMKQQVAPGSTEKKKGKGIWGLFGGVRYACAVCA
jgi:hypothetical protein